MHFCDRRIHFRSVTSLTSIVVQYLQVFAPSFLHNQFLIAIYCRPCSVEIAAEMWLHRGKNLNILITLSKNPVWGLGSYRKITHSALF